MLRNICDDERIRSKYMCGLFVIPRDGMCQNTTGSSEKSGVISVSFIVGIHKPKMFGEINRK